MMTESVTALTHMLLTSGIFAGPIYMVVGLAEALLRSGFDLRRHELSLLANGDFGWIHVAMMVVTGLLTITGAMGLRRALTGGSGRMWGPILLGVYGLGVAIAGLLTADPALGFPPGTPDGRAIVLSWHGIRSSRRREHWLSMPDHRLLRLRAPFPLRTESRRAARA